MECDTSTFGWSADDVSDLSFHPGIFPALRSDPGVRLHEQVAAPAVSDPGGGVDHQGYAAYAAADHQRMNAREIEKTGAALYIEDSDLTPEALINTVENLISNREKLENMAESASLQIKENPTEKILDLILNAAGVLEADNN